MTLTKAQSLENIAQHNGFYSKHKHRNRRKPVLHHQAHTGKRRRWAGQLEPITDHPGSCTLFDGHRRDSAKIRVRHPLVLLPDCLDFQLRRFRSHKKLIMRSADWRSIFTSCFSASGLLFASAAILDQNPFLEMVCNCADGLATDSMNSDMHGFLRA